MNIESFLYAGLALVGAFLTYVSMTTKKYKRRNMTFFEKLGVYFRKCPCGGKIETWSMGKYYCEKCGVKF